MQEENKQANSIPAYLIADADAVRKYGIGMVRPGGKGLDAFIADGYLINGAARSKNLPPNSTSMRTA